MSLVQSREDTYLGWGLVERQEVGPPPPLCNGPLDHETPLESVRLMKKGDPQERETVQFMGSMLFDIILYGGWRAGETSIVKGGVPFLGVKEMSVHWERKSGDGERDEGPNRLPDQSTRIEK